MSDARCATRSDSVATAPSSRPGTLNGSSKPDASTFIECCKHVIPLLARGGGGSVASVSSANPALTR